MSDVLWGIFSLEELLVNIHEHVYNCSINIFCIILVRSTVRTKQHQFQPGRVELVDNAGRCGTARPNLSRETKFSGANWGKNHFFPFQLTTTRIGHQPLNNDTHTRTHTLNASGIERLG